MTTALLSAARLVVNARAAGEDLDRPLSRLAEALKTSDERDGFAAVCWSVDDVSVLQPNWPEARRETWLIQHASVLQSALVEYGWEAMAELVRTSEIRGDRA